MCDQRLWTQVWEALTPLISSSTQLIHLSIPSLPTIDEISAHLSTLIANDSYLVGFSLGGYLASDIALKFPNKITKLLLISNMSSALPAKEKKERARTVQWIKSNGYKGIPDKRINNLLSPIAHNNYKIKDIICAMDNTLGKEVLLQQLKVTTQRENLLPTLLVLTSPIIFCIGEHDSLVDIARIQKNMIFAQEQHLTKTAKTHFNKALKVLKNTGHMLPLEQPDKLAHIIAEWFLEK